MPKNHYLCKNTNWIMTNTQYPTLDEYIRQGEPSKKAKASIWRTAIGLQAVDGLKTSEYLKETAIKHIEGEINIDQVRELIKTYYQSKTRREPDDDDMQEADKVSANITKILSAEALDFSAKGYIALHRRIFEGVFKHAGQIREYNITKQEWVLDNDTVHYLNWEDLRPALEYDIEQERQFSYKGISTDTLIAHIAKFVSGIWQIHAFREGNTRTTAVFTILYLRDLGFNVENDMFAEHSWYFRNALVRANYRNALKNIDYNTVYLERFFRNLLLGDGWDLRNRYLHIDATAELKSQPNIANPTSTPQAPHKYPISTPQVKDILHTDNPNIIKLIQIVGETEMNVKEMMTAIELKDRKSFINTYLTPSISDGYVRMLYPDSPRHPRQKYLLTAKGVTLFQELQKRKV